MLPFCLMLLLDCLDLQPVEVAGLVAEMGLRKGVLIIYYTLLPSFLCLSLLSIAPAPVILFLPSMMLAAYCIDFSLAARLILPSCCCLSPLPCGLLSSTCNCCWCDSLRRGPIRVTNNNLRYFLRRCNPSLFYLLPFSFPSCLHLVQPALLACM